MPTTYAQKQSPAQKKDAPTAASVLDASTQSERLHRKACMVDNNVIQCYPMIPSFRTNHIGNTDDESVKRKLSSRINEDKNIKKNSVLIPDAVEALSRYSEVLDGGGRKWQPIKDVPCVTAYEKGLVQSDLVSVWITNDVEGHLGHVAENDAMSINNGGFLNLRCNRNPCVYNDIKNAVDSRSPLTVPQKTVNPYQERVKNIQENLENEFKKYIGEEYDCWVYNADKIPCYCYDMEKIIEIFNEIDEKNKYNFYLNFTEKYTDDSKIAFQTILREKWKDFFERDIKQHYTKEEENMFTFDVSTEVSTLVWKFYTGIVLESCF